MTTGIKYIFNDNNYCIDNEKEKLTENSTNIIVNSYNECEEKQSSSNESQNNVFIGIEDLSSDDEEIDDTDKDKDCTPTLLECNESLEDFPLDLDLFLNDENILNDDDITDNPPNISDFNFEKAGCSPEKYKLTRFREVHGSGNKNIYNMCPIQIFNMIMGNMYQKIVFESNLYAEQHNISLNTNIEELKAFLGLLIYMGYHELPGIRLYWSNDPNFYCDRVAKVMPVKQFLKLLRCIHLNDNSKMPQRQSQEFDKLFKIRPMLSHLQEKYKTMYKPSRHLAVDESMVAFKGRSSMKQFMPLKPIKRGFKVWALADSQSGFLLNFDVYTGKKSDGNVEYGLGENVVISLTDTLKNKFYCIYFDNFFTSIPLISKLLNGGLFACGTFRVNKKFYPKHLMKSDNKYMPGDIEYAQSKDISVMRWKDRGAKPVTLISNMHNASESTIVNRKNKKGEKIAVKCPVGISDYNKHMGGVDKFDQYMANYSISQKSRRWWLKLFYYMIDTAVVNSFILYKESCNTMKKKYINHLEFRSRLTDELISDFSSRKNRLHHLKIEL
eukprot:XP_016660574.1 PREDICTED: piggyBac transposable element-derived protein 4-like [Acyrthosiphon pisum]